MRLDLAGFHVQDYFRPSRLGGQLSYLGRALYRAAVGAREVGFGANSLLVSRASTCSTICATTGFLIFARQHARLGAHECAIACARSFLRRPTPRLVCLGLDALVLAVPRGSAGLAVVVAELALSRTWPRISGDLAPGAATVPAGGERLRPACNGAERAISAYLAR